jgi:hypothetical protein
MGVLGSLYVQTCSYLFIWEIHYYIFSNHFLFHFLQDKILVYNFPAQALSGVFLAEQIRQQQLAAALESRLETQSFSAMQAAMLMNKLKAGAETTKLLAAAAAAAASATPTSTSSTVSVLRNERPKGRGRKQQNHQNQNQVKLPNYMCII